VPMREESNPGVRAAFDWWAGLDTPATRATALEEWDATMYHDAICFTKRGASGDDVYMIRGTSLVHFGTADATYEQMYSQLRALQERPRGVTTALPRRNLRTNHHHHHQVLEGAQRV
jgi:hypothetical protein